MNACSSLHGLRWAAHWRGWQAGAAQESRCYAQHTSALSPLQAVHWPH